ncbi:MAG: rRNA maturation RNase YbeY [bacterium]|nr:rRNA maturation RNase YbeY [bacterium]
MQVQIINRQRKEPISNRKINNIVNKILKYLKVKGKISIVFCNDQFIKKLNKEYRSINKPTDVLSFAFRETFYPLDIEQSFLGEIIISVQIVRKQANRFKHSFDKELTILLIHGILHLLEYNHLKIKDAARMQKKEKELLALI